MGPLPWRGHRHVAGGQAPEQVKSLSLHSAWPRHAFQKAVIEGWQTTARALNSVPEMTIRASSRGALRPSCTSPGPNTLNRSSLCAEPASTARGSLPQQSTPAIAHDAELYLGEDHCANSDYVLSARHDNFYSLCPSADERHTRL